MFDTVLNVDTQLANTIVGVIIPLLTALLAKRVASSAVKAVTTTVLTAVAAFFTLALGPDGVVLRDYLASAVQIFATAIISYYGLTKHTVAPVIADKTANVGVGTTTSKAA